MRLTTILLLAFLAAEPLSAQTTDPHLARARRVLRQTPLIDGHNDLPWAIRTDSVAPRDVEKYDLRKATRGHTDLARLKAGMVGGQFWSVYIPANVRDSGYARVQLEQIEIARQVVAKYPEIEWALTADALRASHARGRIGSLLGLEGGHAIENSLGALRAYYDLGARYLTLTHSANIDWADSGTDSVRHGGLTKFGEEVVREMNRLGMLVDLSHVSPATMSDALNVTEAPVIFSHSSARGVTEHPRNVPDSILRRLPQNGGVVMVTFVPVFVSQRVAQYGDEMQRTNAELRQRFPNDDAARRREMDAWRATHPAPKATLKDVADHIDHVRRVAGVDHVGIGSDFDGINDTPVGLEDVSTFPALFAELSRRGWTEEALRKLAGENLLRVLKRAEAVSARLKQQRPPSTRTIQEMDGTRT
jgi:membrane dipeptidase